MPRWLRYHALSALGSRAEEEAADAGHSFHVCLPCSLALKPCNRTPARRAHANRLRSSLLFGPPALKGQFPGSLTSFLLRDLRPAEDRQSSRRFPFGRATMTRNHCRDGSVHMVELDCILDGLRDVDLVGISVFLQSS